MSGRVIDGPGVVVELVELVLDVGTLVEVGGEPICVALGMRLGSGAGKGMDGWPDSASRMYAPQMPAG